MLNVPTQLFRGFLNGEERTRVINDILCFAIYQKTEELKGDYKKALDELQIYSENIDDSLKRGAHISSIITSKSFFRIDKSKLFELRDGKHKNDFYITSLMYYALGSIIGKRPWCKLTNSLLIYRMDGYDAPICNVELSSEIKNIFTRRKLERYKSILYENKLASFFGYNVRGFFASTTMSLDELINVVKSPKKPKSNKTKKTVLNEKIKQIMEQLE